jgi:integrase
VEFFSRSATSDHTTTRGAVYTRRDSPNLWLWYYDQSGKRRLCSSGTPDPAHAWQILRRLQKAPPDALAAPPRHATPLRQQLLAILHEQVRTGSKSDHSGINDRQRISVFADYCDSQRDIRFVHEISSSVLNDFAYWLSHSRGVSNSTVNRYLNAIGGVLPDKIKVHRLPVREGIGKEIPEPVFHQILEAAGAIDPTFRLFLILLAETGLRTGHLCTAETTWIKTYRYGDELRRFLNFPAGASHRSKRAPLVPLNAVACAVIDGLRSQCLRRYIFDSGNNVPRYTPFRIHRRWRRIVLRLGCPEYRPYDVRHTWAIREIMRTGDIAYVSKVLGHSKMSTTLNYYQNLSTARLIERNTGSNVSGISPTDI